MSTIRNTSVPVFSGTAHARALSLGVGNAQSLVALSGNPEPLAPETQTRVQAWRSSCPSPTGAPFDNLAKELMMHGVLSDSQQTDGGCRFGKDFLHGVIFFVEVR